jgi:hypothetical protein
MIKKSDDEIILETVREFIIFAHSGLAFCYPLTGLEQLHAAEKILALRVFDESVKRMALQPVPGYPSPVTSEEKNEQRRARARAFNALFPKPPKIEPGREFYEEFARMLQLYPMPKWESLDEQTRKAWATVEANAK